MLVPKIADDNYTSLQMVFNKTLSKLIYMIVKKPCFFETSVKKNVKDDKLKAFILNVV